MKILILGAAGMLGHQVWSKCLDAFGSDNVAGTLRKSKSHYQRFEIFTRGHIFENLDVGVFSEVEKVLAEYHPDIVINCIGLTLRKQELGDIEKCIEINSMLPHRLELWAKKNRSRIIHFSTDCVFDGKVGNYAVDEVPTANDLYGKSKFLGEVSSSNALTLRLSIVGRELEGKTELLEWFLAQKNKKIKGFSRALYSGLTTNFVAQEVVKIIKEYPNLHGVYQVSSEPISKYELLNLANDIFQVNAEIAKADEDVSDKTLNSDLYASETNFKKPTWAMMLKQLASDKSINYGE